MEDLEFHIIDNYKEEKILKSSINDVKKRATRCYEISKKIL